MYFVWKLSSKKISDCATPTLSTDVANKAYVDGAGTGVYLPIAGGTMTGNVNMGAHNISNGGSITSTTGTIGNLSIATDVNYVVDKFPYFTSSSIYDQYAGK